MRLTARQRSAWRAGAAAAACALALRALAQPDPSGIDFVRVGSPGNAAYAGPDINRRVTGRGSVPYEFQIGRTEVTTAQWMEFYNAFYGRVPGLEAPQYWGAVDQGAGHSPRFVLSNGANSALWPVSTISWRTCAMYVNWLCNDKSLDVSAVRNGAYDTSTFGYDGNVFTDQQAHNPSARYWIPTMDEWMKAGFFDPNNGGPGVGGWWYVSPNGTNTRLIHGPPGVGQSNSAFSLPGDAEFRIPLGAYPDVRSPWGALDMAGATSEFNESVLNVDGVLYRNVANSHWTDSDRGHDEIYGMGGEFPNLPSLYYGLRVASSVPNPGTLVFLGAASAWCIRRGR